MRLFYIWCQVVVAILFLSTQAKSQPILTRLDSVSHCPDSLLVQVLVDNFSGVASLSLIFNYDTLSLQYKGYQNLHSALAGNFLMNGDNGHLIMSWYSLTPVNIVTGLMVEVKFLYKNNTNVILNWEDPSSGNCVYTDLDGIELPAIFEDGYIHGLMHTPQTLVPADNATGVPTNPLLHWTGSGCGSLYSIELAEDSLFSNIIVTNPSVFGTSLPVVDLNMEQTYFWRLHAYNSSFITAWSEISRFKTTSLGMNEDWINKTPRIYVAPNPATTLTKISFHGISGEQYTLELFNALGNVVSTHTDFKQSNERINFSLVTDHLSPGLYFVVIKNNLNSWYKTSRLIIAGSR